MTRETVARGACDCCSGEVAVKTNVSGKAYYNCDHCGAKVQHTWQRSSDAYLAKLKPGAAPAPAPASDASGQLIPSNHKPARGAGTVLG